jgi:hypothetical protein
MSGVGGWVGVSYSTNRDASNSSCGQAAPAYDSRDATNSMVTSSGKDASNSNIMLARNGRDNTHNSI